MNQRIDPRTGKTLPPIAVLEFAARLPDSAVDGDEEIAEWNAQLIPAREHWQGLCKSFDVIRFKIEGLLREVEEIQAEVSAIEDKRPAAIADALLADDNFCADDKLLTRRAALSLRAERIALAKTALERRQHEAERPVELAANIVRDLEGKIAERRRELKLSEAGRRCV